MLGGTHGTWAPQGTEWQHPREPSTPRVLYRCPPCLHRPADKAALCTLLPGSATVRGGLAGGPGDPGVWVCQQPHLEGAWPKEMWGRCFLPPKTSGKGRAG